LAFPLFRIFEENAMNISALSRADLVSELLSPLAYPSASGQSNLCNPTILVAKDDPRASLLARRLDVARELLLRDLHEQMRSTPIMSSPQALRDWLRLHCAGLEHEVFLVLYLDAHHRLIEAEELFRGTLTQTSVYPRELVKGALARNAAALAVAHNHPSGEAEPSRADELLTQNLKSALSLVDVRVIDHFVVAGDQILSFAERGLV
jgi:DNA repair protein RadC